MKRIAFLLMCVIAGAVVAFAQLQAEKGSRMCWMNRAGRASLAKPEALTGGPMHAYDVQNYKLTLDIFNCFRSPFPASYNGQEIITFLVDSSLSSITLNAVNSSLIVDSVKLAATGFTHSGNLLTITLDRSYAPSEIVNVGLYFRHQDIQDGAFYTSSDSMVFTDCEPQGARSWFPCWDAPADKATWDLTARVPSSVKLGSNGRLADSTAAGDTTVFHWVSRDPVATYLMVLTAKSGYHLDIVNWPRLSNPAETIPIRFYWNTGEDNNGLSYIESIIIPMTNRYSQLFGEQPFEKNGFATLDTRFPWGGMENQTLTSLCPNCWAEGLISHEYAHQWFGDMITCGTWSDIWLNEGFATYCEALWQEVHSAAAYKSEVDYEASSYLGGNPGWPIYNASWATNPPDNGILFNYAITYAKGACVLHMLRYTLGDSLFFAALKSYASDSTFKYKTAVTPEFVAKVSQVSGQDLSWFFNEWVYQANHPQYQNTYSIFSSPSSSTWNVDFLVKQTQPKPGFFAMPIELKISFQTGPDTLLRVMNIVNSQTFHFTFNRMPTNVQFDPNNNIVLKTASTTEVNTVAEDAQQPLRFALGQNYPNPFNPSTTITYELAREGPVRLEVFDALGQLVDVLVNGAEQLGRHEVVFENRSLASGLYVYRLTAGTFVKSRAMILLK
jgi:aminopeptidase N